MKSFNSRLVRLSRKAFAASLCGLMLPAVIGFSNVNAASFVSPEFTVFPEFIAADPELVGVLASAVEPSTATKLNLTENQLNQLQAIIKQREGKGLDLAQQLRDLPPEERDVKKRAYIYESESAGFAILNSDQKIILGQIRMNKMGMTSLAMEEVSKFLELSEGQGKQVSEILASRPAIIREVGREKSAETMDQRLKSVLTAPQFAMWQSMAGQSPRASSSKTVSKEATKDEAKGEKTAEQAAVAQDSAAKEQKAKLQAIANGNAPDSDLLVLNFKATPWDEVLKFIAREAQLSIVSNKFPEGSFTYADPYRKYTVAQAMDVINGVLLKDGFAIVRRNQAISIVDLGGEPEAVRMWLREISQLVSPKELETVGEFELCKTLFVLSRLTADEAKKEIERLIGPQGSVIALNSSGQVLVCETGGKLRLINELLKRVEDPETAPGAKVITIPLVHVSAEEVLSVVRPLVGLTGEANTSTDFNVSMDAFATTIFASGKPEKLQILKEMSKRIDVEPTDTSAGRASVDQPKLKMYKVLSGDLEAIYKVLETLLANSPTVRMSKEDKNSSIIALATSSDHDLIVKTITELSGEGSSLNVIPLKRIDPQTAITALEKVFGKKTEKEAATSNIPTFLGDAAARTLLVQCTPSQLARVQQIVDTLESSGNAPAMGGNFKQIPGIMGKSTDRLLKNVEDLMAMDPSKKIQFRVIGNPPKSDKDKEKDSKASRRSPPPTSEPKATPNLQDSSKTKSNPASSTGQVSAILASIPMGLMGSILIQETAVQEKAVQEKAQEPGKTVQTPSGKEIVILQGPTGLIVTSEDPEALAEFEQLARIISDQMAMAPPEPATIYLRHIKAAAASELLKSVLSGETAGGGGGGGGLLSNLAGNALGELGGGMFRGLLGGGGSTTSSSSTSGIASGKPMIIPDPRLNALIVTATPLDLDLIESLIDIIDQADSPVENETRGSVQRIPVQFNDVEEIAKAVRELFKDRIAGAADAGGGGAQQQQQQIIQAMLGGGGRGGRGGGGGGAQSQLKEATMTLTTDAKSNSLFVMAPPALFEQVKEVVEMLDKASEQQEETTKVGKIDGSLNPTVVQRALTSLYGAQIKTNLLPTTPTTGGQNNQRGNNQQGQTRNFGAGFPGAMGGGAGNFGGFAPGGFGTQGGRGGQGTGGQGGGRGGQGTGGQGTGGRGGNAGGRGGAGGFQ